MLLLIVEYRNAGSSFTIMLPLLFYLVLDATDFYASLCLMGVLALQLDYWLSSYVSLGLVGRLFQVVICWKIGSIRPGLCFKAGLLRISLSLGY